MSDCVIDMVQNGKLFREVWNKLWQDLAREAIQRLLQVQAKQSLLGMIAGLTGKRSGVSNIATTLANPFGLRNSSGNFFADGGLIKGSGTGTSDSILTYLADQGKFIKTSNGEYIIRDKAVQKYGTQFLDLVNAGKFANGGKIGTTVESYLKNPNLVKNNEAILPADAKINREMSKQLAMQNSLMEQQNSMIGNMGSNGGNVVVMPVAPDAQSVLKILQDNPRAVQAILGQNRRMGFR